MQNGLLKSLEFISILCERCIPNYETGWAQFKWFLNSCKLSFVPNLHKWHLNLNFDFGFRRLSFDFVALAMLSCPTKPTTAMDGEREKKRQRKEKFVWHTVGYTGETQNTINSIILRLHHNHHRIALKDFCFVSKN